MQAPVEAMCAVELNTREYLLVFANLGVYVDSRGRRSREQEIMWPSVPNFVSEYRINLLLTCSYMICFAAFMDPHILCYSEEAIYIFNTVSAEWVQTLCVKKPKPLSSDGSLTLATVSDNPRLIYINTKQGKYHLLHHQLITNQTHSPYRTRQD